MEAQQGIWDHNHVSFEVMEFEPSSINECQGKVICAKIRLLLSVLIIQLRDEKRFFSLRKRFAEQPSPRFTLQ